jgi:4-hydroxythreonine-4-phosphate dehydrogenase
MIHITQGHEKSIGLEVLFKSLLMISPSQTSGQMTLYVSKEALAENLAFFHFDYALIKNRFHFEGHDLALVFLDPQSATPLSTQALELSLVEIQENDILLTLPTSKDQLIFNNQTVLGHTEFLRAYFKNPAVPMVFKGPELLFLLLSDHIPLSKVSSALTTNLVIEKVKATLEGLLHHFEMPSEVYFAGINPHAGEGGLLGSEDQVLSQSISKLKLSYPGIEFHTPASGDSLHHFFDSRKKQLFVYAYHDQALPLFKSKQVFWGLNISFGLPFLRLSVDHGTAFDLWGKNKANFLGCYDVLKNALRINKRHEHK